MATREITDEQAGEIAERLARIDSLFKEGKYWDKSVESLAFYERADGCIDVAEIRRLLGFPA